MIKDLFNFSEWGIREWGALAGILGLGITLLSLLVKGVLQIFGVIKNKKQKREEWRLAYSDVANQLALAMTKQYSNALINSIISHLSGGGPFREIDGLDPLTKQQEKYTDAKIKYLNHRRTYSKKSKSHFTEHCAQADLILRRFEEYLDDVQLVIWLTAQPDLEMAIYESLEKKSKLMTEIVHSQIQGQLSNPKDSLRNIIALRFVDSAQGEEAAEFRMEVARFLEEDEAYEKISSIDSAVRRVKMIRADAQARFDLGVWYLENGLWSEGERWLLDAAERGHVEANYRLGRFYWEKKTRDLPDVFQEYYLKGKAFLEKAIEGGSDEAKLLLGKALMLQVDSDSMIKGMELVKEVLNENDDLVQFLFVLPFIPRESRPEFGVHNPWFDDHFQRYDRLSHAEFPINLFAKERKAALMLHKMGREERDQKEGKRLMEEAIDGLINYLGSAPADFFLREAALRFIIEAFEEMKEYYEEYDQEGYVAFVKPLAEKGALMYPYYLGEYYKGQGKLGEAVRCYRIGTANGDPFATDSLGLCYLEGTGVPQDMSTAKGLFEKARAQDLTHAIHHLAVMYFRNYIHASSPGLLRRVVIPLAETVSAVNYSEGYYLLGRCYTELGEAERAFEYYKKAYQSGSKDMDAYMEAYPDLKQKILKAFEDDWMFKGKRVEIGRPFVSDAACFNFIVREQDWAYREYYGNRQNTD
jgi:TPR repeat protein